MKDVVILGGMRTPMGEYNGSLSDFSAIDLGSIAAKAALQKTGVAPQEVQHSIFGNALQTSGDAIYGARHVALKSGVPVSVPALTVNRLCGSGIQSIVEAAHLIQLEEAEIVLAGGMESLSQAPHVIRGLRKGLRLGEGQLEDLLMVSLMDTYCGFYMAQTSDNLARECNIGREEQDVYALRSQKAATAAWEAGKFKEEIVPVEIRSRKGTVLFDRDDHMRPESTLEGLAGLKPHFSKDGFVTAGNASGIVDGAAAVLVCSSREAERRNAAPLGRIISWAYVGVEPRIMGSGPVPATQEALKKAGLSLTDVDLVEVNEAFAGQYLAVEKLLGLDREKVNVNGGAIALGHPLGATGTRLVLTLLLELRRRKKKIGVATACIGGGQGIAMVVEAF
ncbi:acetyl-CoA C-acetyltransferase [bacterium]|nr:acetyl-CoA C-acetyltransferase [bacterium]MCI0602640.1 acetyl-CoA C-acetyltransferase [bacterium]